MSEFPKNEKKIILNAVLPTVAVRGLDSYFLNRKVINHKTECLIMLEIHDLIALYHQAVEKKVSFGGVFDLAIEQLQLVRKLH